MTGPAALSESTLAVMCSEAYQRRHPLIVIVGRSWEVKA